VHPTGKAGKDEPVSPWVKFAAIAVFIGVLPPALAQSAAPRNPVASAAAQIVYRNAEYGFCFAMPANWKGYTIVNEQWNGAPLDGGPALTGSKLLIRNPAWTAEDPREDIPIMIFTSAQWRRVKKEGIAVSAAPFGPFQLGHNRRYVFALPPRFDFDQLPGVEEVGKLLMGKSLKAPCG
jgi:hypothetical protein